MADGLAGELTELAERGIDRTFQRVGAKGPLELPLFFGIVDQVCHDLWQGVARLIA